MTYPPPPGVPGDPGQQPMHDPYAPGGGFAPPPADPYGTPPPTSDPYGTPPPTSDPYGTPPQMDPYGAPPQDPYGQPPMSGVPMSPGAPGMAPDPYGQPPMGGMPGQPPSFLGGQPPQKKSNLGWILGGVGGAAVLIILVVVGIVMFNSSGKPDDEAGGDNNSGEESGGEEPSDDGGEGGGGDYKVTEGMCEQFDVSKVPSSFGLSKFSDITVGDEMYCTADSSTSAVISVKGKAYADSKEAESGYEEYKKNEIVGGDGLVEFTGDWDKGEISQYANLEGTASVFIQDGNMAVTMFISSTEGSTNDEAKEAAVIFAEQTFKAASA